MIRDALDIVIQHNDIATNLLREGNRAELREVDCPICHGEYENGTLLTQTRCGHVYHYVCLVPSLLRGNRY